MQARDQARGGRQAGGQDQIRAPNDFRESAIPSALALQAVFASGQTGSGAGSPTIF
jgi:hypothetical protein